MRADLANTFNARMASNLPTVIVNLIRLKPLPTSPRNKDIVVASYKNPLSESPYYEKEIHAGTVRRS